MLEDIQIKLNEMTFSQQVFHHIKRLILSEDLKPGQRIPEEKIGQKFGVSRTPIREALRKLEQYGLVRIVPRSHAEVVSMNPASAKSLWEVRILLERHAVMALATNATEDDIEAMTRIADECQRVADKGDIAMTFELDNEFHLEIARRCGNEHVYELLSTLSGKIHLHRTTYCTDIDQIRKDIRRHYDIIRALESHDVDRSISLLTNHISDGEHQQA